MRPITIGDARPGHLLRRLFLLNPKLVAVHYLEMVLNRAGYRSAQNPTQFVLSAGLWDVVLNGLVNEATRPGVQYQLVTATLIPAYLPEKVLRCVGQEFVLPADGGDRFPQALDNDPAMT